jgi:hypothetical protein
MAGLRRRLTRLEHTLRNVIWLSTPTTGKASSANGSAISCDHLASRDNTMTRKSAKFIPPFQLQGQLACPGVAFPRCVNAALVIVEAVAPRDDVEAALAV